MAYREVSVVEVREVLRGWLGGAGLRIVAEQAGVDRKTARRYVQAAEAAGVVREGGWAQVTAGLAAGEHVVSKGAYEIKLASSAGAVPAHGHAH